MSAIFSCVLAFAQIGVTGVVMDESGEPIPGAAVYISDSMVGTTTDLDGKWQIEVPDNSAQLTFSCIGYEDQKIAVGSRRTFKVVLKESANFIEEAVAVGYGTMNKKDLTGAVSSIKSEALENKVLFSVDDALAGGVAGLMVSSSSGKPGAETNMLLRGANSLSGSTAPLIVVDGFPLFEVSTGSGGASDYDTGMSSLSLINTDDIASIEVLKDASATAIYGNRGSNGVILITTKKGRQNGGKIQYNSYFGVQEMSQRYPMMDFYQYADYQALNNESNWLFFDTATGQARRYDTGVQTRNWQDEIYRTGLLHNQSLSVSHSTQKTNFLFSGSYLDNRSVLICTDWRKFTAKATVDHYFTDHIRMGVDMSYSRVSDEGVPTGGEGLTQVAGVIIEALIAPPYDFDEQTCTYMRRAGVSQDDINSYKANYRNNPVTTANDSQLSKIMNRTIINSYFEADLLPDLLLRITAGFDNYSLKDRQFYPTTTPRGYFYQGQGLISSSEASSWINENTLTWRPTFGKHRLNILLGMSEQGYTNYFDQSEAQQFEYEGLGFNNMQMATVFNSFSSKGQTRFISFMGRANYSYDSRYSATLTVRRDGSSNFVANKWGTFFSGAAAWNVDQEEFMKNQTLVSTLKLRASLGQVGNSNVPTNGSYAQLANTRYSYGGNAAVGQVASSLANESLTWETTTEVNFGLETGFFNDRLGLNVDVYDKLTSGLLLEAPVMNISGYDKAWQNIGKLQNRGVELTLKATPVMSKDFQWNVNANFALNKTKILELGQNGAPIYMTVTCLSGQNAAILEEGGAVGDIFGYVTEGVYGWSDFEADGITPRPGVAIQTGSERPGTMKLKDISGPEGVPDGKITADDRVIIGNSLPDWYGSFGTDITWKRFNLSAQFQYSFGNDVYNANYNSIARFTGMSYNQSATWANRWSEDNLGSTMYNVMMPGTVVSAFVEDASYLRCKTLRLTYSFPSAKWMRTAHINSVRAYLAADNLFVLTNYSGYDPEVYSKQGGSSMSGVLTSGFDYGCFPRARSFTIGVNLSFE